MKKLCAYLLLLSILILCTTSCNKQPSQKQNLIQSKRRFAEYMEPQQHKDPNTVDLSEGPKLKYDANLGPKNLNFDIKIVDPY